MMRKRGRFVSRRSRRFRNNGSYGRRLNPYTRALFKNMPSGNGRELKSLDFVVSQAYGVGSGNYVLTALNLIVAGSSVWQRLGRKVCWESIRFRGFLATPGGNSESTGSVNDLRTMIFYDAQTNGTLPAATDVLLDYPQNGTGVTNAFSNLRIDNRDRFRVLMDDYRIMPAVTATSPTAQQFSPYATSKEFHFDRYIRLNGLETMYKADSSPGVIGDVATGSLILLTGATYGVSAYPYYIAGVVRLRFYDV